MAPMHEEILAGLDIDIFADGADLASMIRYADNPLISGFTTNPSLMEKSGIADYRTFGLELLEHIPHKPISFEVFSDDFTEMERQAKEIAGWGENVFVKVPITNTRRETAYDLIKRLSDNGVKLNVTAVFTERQVEGVLRHLSNASDAYISIFAGRIADTGRDPAPTVRRARELVAASSAKLIWASAREILNIFQADAAGSHAITLTHDLVEKLSLVGKDLDEYSLETVKMFHDSAQSARYAL